MLRESLLIPLFLGSSQLVQSFSFQGARDNQQQAIFAPSPDLGADHATHVVDEAILAAIETLNDPVEALIALRPDAAAELAQPRLLHVMGQKEPEWLTEGDKLRLRRQRQKFMDITDHVDFYAEQAKSFVAGKANTPDLDQQQWIKPLLTQVSTQRLHDALKHLSSYYNRFYGDIHGERSSEWLHDQVAQIISDSPFRTHISLEYFTHSFPQSSIIARFEPGVRNFSKPLTIIGAHQDSANYLFPLLPAPGADDDGSGTVSILEAFRILAESGYTPKDGPVEFHWYAAEEGGLLGSQDIARYKRESGANIGAMLEFDMVAYVARNTTETVGFVSTQADAALTNWTVKLGEEYISLPAKIYELDPRAGSDYMSYTRVNYPSAFATEGNPLAGGFPGEMDPHVHGVNDTMDVDDEDGYFSLDHAAQFTKLAIAFVVEQAGWDNPRK